MAASPQIKVQISAVDQYSAQLAKMRKDLADTSRAADVASKRIGGIQAPTPDFSRYRKGLDAINEHASSRLQLAMRGGIPGLGMVGSISGTIPGLGALAGVGAVGGVGSLLERFASSGVSLENTARLGGTSPAGLASFRGAARLLGVDAGVADQAMIGFNQTLGDSFYGKDPRAAAMLRQLGIGLQGVAGGAAKAEEKMPQLADRIQLLAKSDPRAAVTALEALHIPVDFLPVLIRGSEGIAEFRKQIEDVYGSFDAYLRSSERFTDAMGRLGTAADRVGMSILVGLEPHLTPLLKQLADYVDRHQKDIGDVFDHLGAAIGKIDWGAIGRGMENIGTTTRNVVNDVQALIDKYEVYKRVVLGQTPSGIADAAAAFWTLAPDKGATPRERNIGAGTTPFGGGRIGTPSGPAPSTPERERRALLGRNMLMQMGWSPEAAAGIMANLNAESGLNESNVGDSGSAYGIAQWHPDRRAAIQQGTGINLVGASFEDQIRAVDWELRHNESAAGARLRAAGSAADAGDIASRYYERPRNADVDASNRARAADAWYRRWAALPPAPTLAPEPPAQEPDLTRGGRVPPAAPQQPDLTRGGRLPALLAPPTFAPAPTVDNSNGSTVRIEIDHSNVPSGVSMNATTQGNGAEIGSIRTRRAMPDAGYAPAFGGT